MSYRAPEQSLEEPIDMILEGMKAFSAAVSERVKSHEWKKEHLQEIAALRSKLLNLEFELHSLKEDTW